MKLEHRKDNRVVLSVPLRYKIFQLENLEKEVRDQVLGLKGELKDLAQEASKSKGPRKIF